MSTLTAQATTKINFSVALAFFKKASFDNLLCMAKLDLWLKTFSQRRVQILSRCTSIMSDMDSVKKHLNTSDIIRSIPLSKKSSIRASFVDGGQGLTELMGLGMYLVRASALTVSCNPSMCQDEDFLRDLDMDVIRYDHNTKERIDLKRDALEFEVALRSIEENKPSVVVLDGSLYVKAYRKPLYNMEYKKYKRMFARLVGKCRREGVLLVGVSEDSKSRLFTRHIQKTYRMCMPPFLTDSSVLKLIGSKEGFATKTFVPDVPWDLSKGEPNLKDLRFPTSYLCIKKSSNPLRVDILGDEENMDAALSLTNDLTKGSGRYDYPIPLYLVHLDARIKTNHMDWTSNQLLGYISKNNTRLADALLSKTRRLCRPTLHLG